MLSKLRISAHKLAIEGGRYLDIPKHERICTACNSGEVENEDLLVGFVALRPKSTAMVIAGRSVHLTTLFPGQA